MTPAELLALSDERDAQLALRHADRREGYRLGDEAGYRRGYEQAAADLEAGWHEMASRVARGDSRSHAELEAERWKVHGEPRTRDTYGLPHPADRCPRGGGPR
jgi:hypothetical protein